MARYETPMKSVTAAPAISSSVREAFLDRYLTEKVRYAKEKGIKEVGMISNGSLISPEIAQGMIDAGLDAINISVDASGKETMSCCDAACCKDGAESCPMMKKDASGKTEHSECPMMKKDASGATADKHDAASCPMMNKDASASTNMDMKHDMKGMSHADMKAMHGEGCSCPCCHKDKKEEKPKDAAGA